MKNLVSETIRKENIDLMRFDGTTTLILHLVPFHLVFVLKILDEEGLVLDSVLGYFGLRKIEIRELSAHYFPFKLIVLSVFKKFFPTERLAILSDFS